MKLKLLFITVALFGVCFSGWGQLLQWNTFGNDRTETTEPSTFNNTNISATNLTQGTITAAVNGNRFGGSNWFNTGNTIAGNTLTEALAGNDYIQFIVTPNSGFSFTPTSFVFNWENSNTGPLNVALRSSVDSFASNIGIVAPVASIGTSNTITISGLINITTATTFRIYGYGATGTAGTGGFDVESSVINVQLNGTTSATKIVNGIIAAGEYGTHTNGNNQQSSATGTWYMTSDAINLYIGISGANTTQGAVIYLDKNPITPVNGGANSDGTLLGNNFDGSSFGNLQFRADLAVYFKDGYQEFRTSNGANGWTGATTTGMTYSSAGGSVREIVIPWSSIGGQPVAYNWFGYVAYTGGGAYASLPTENPGSGGGLTIGSSATWDRYYTVSTPTTMPFSRNSYTFTSATDVTSFGAISAYDFTMNSPGRFVSRTGNVTGNWTIGKFNNG